MRVGFIGLGNMGEPLAGFVRKAGFPLVVHDLRRETAATLLAAGATWAESPRDVAAHSDVVCVCVPGPPEMQAVTLGSGGILEGISAGSVVIEPTLSEADFKELAERGVWLAKYGFGAFADPSDGEPQIRWAQANGLNVMCHTGGASIPGSQPVTAEHLLRLLPDVAGHVNGAPDQRT